MSKQRPDADKLASEFAGASAFFRPAQPAPEPEPAPPPGAPSTPDETPERDVTTSPTAPPTPAKEGFDLNRPTASRDSLRLSLDETRALDALRQALKWDYDLTVSKNDICRAALHWLLEDWSAKREKAEALRRLKRKQTSR